MEKKDLLKKIGIPALLLIVIVAGYFLFIADSTTLSLSAPPPPNPEISRIERQILTLLSELQDIELRSEIFESQAYESLVDFSVEIVPEPVGRENPFLPSEGSSLE